MIEVDTTIMAAAIFLAGLILGFSASCVAMIGIAVKIGRGRKEGEGDG